jgi:hypothetical protein
MRAMRLVSGFSFLRAEGMHRKRNRKTHRPKTQHQLHAQKPTRVRAVRALVQKPEALLKLEWLLNGSSRSRAAPGLGKPLNEPPDRDHDER